MTTKKKKTKELVPADLNRCQAEISSYNAFNFGKSTEVKRCPNFPKFLAKEKTGKVRGEMSLCIKCAEVAMKREEFVSGKVKLQKIKHQPCAVKSHFTCDGTGQMCRICFESELSCECDSPDLEDCEDCDGTGQFCVEHGSGCSDKSKNPKCILIQLYG